MIYGVGTDICDVRRIRDSLLRHGDRFAAKVLCDAEFATWQARSGRWPERGVRYLATRFSAKEAFSKAIGLGMRMPMTWRLCEIANQPQGHVHAGQPFVVLHGGHCTDALLQTVTALDAHSLEVVYTEDAPEARVAHAGGWVGGRSVMMYGGTNMLHPPAYDDCLMFDAGSKQW